MAAISYEAFQTNKEEREARTSGPRIGYFGLKNDQDEAVVRFMHNSPADFDIMYIHPVQVNGRYRNVNCIRDPKQPISDCPFCEAKQKLQTKVFIHLLEYTKDEQGNIVATPKIWERASSYITTLKNLCDEYPPLSDNIFKIKRNGAAGSMETTYAIMYANPQIYRSDLYRKDDEAFNGVKALGTHVLDRSYEQLAQMLSNPDGAATNTTRQAPVSTAPVEPTRTYQPTTPTYAEPAPTPIVNTYVDPTPAFSTNVEASQAPRSYNPGSAYVTGQEDMSFIRPKRLG